MSLSSLKEHSKITFEMDPTREFIFICMVLFLTFLLELPPVILLFSSAILSVVIHLIVSETTTVTVSSSTVCVYVSYLQGFPYQYRFNS